MTCRRAARPSASRRFHYRPLRLRGRPAALAAWNTLNKGNPGRPGPAPTMPHLKRRPRRRRAAGLTRRRRAPPARAPRLPRPGPPSLELRWYERARRPARRLRRRMLKPRAVAAMASRSTRCRGDGVQGDRKKKTTPPLYRRRAPAPSPFWGRSWTRRPRRSRRRRRAARD